MNVAVSVGLISETRFHDGGRDAEVGWKEKQDFVVCSWVEHF